MRQPKKTPIHRIGTITQDSVTFINFNSFNICYKQISDKESEEILVYF